VGDIFQFLAIAREEDGSSTGSVANTDDIALFV
jgi:hypothetical protein